MFRVVLKSMKKMLVVLFPWNNPTVFTRAWNLFEVFCAIDSECYLEVAFTEQDREILKNASPEIIEAIVSKINLGHSVATRPEDGESVRRTIIKHSGGGMERFNEIIRSEVKDGYMRYITK
jgi:hypothetical protein